MTPISGAFPGISSEWCALFVIVPSTPRLKSFSLGDPMARGLLQVHFFVLSIFSGPHHLRARIPGCAKAPATLDRRAVNPYLFTVSSVWCSATEIGPRAGQNTRASSSPAPVLGRAPRTLPALDEQHRLFRQHPCPGILPAQAGIPKYLTQ